MDDHMFEGAIGAAILDVDGRGIAGVEGLHGSGEQFEREREVEHLNGLEVGKLCDLAPGGEQHICMVVQAALPPAMTIQDIAEATSGDPELSELRKRITRRKATQGASFISAHGP